MNSRALCGAQPAASRPFLRIFQRILMPVVILFEVEFPSDRPEAREEYMRLAASLKDELAKAKGFLGSERFVSVAAPGRLLSKSVWESLECARAWRANALHAESQRTGLERLFSRCHITVLEEIESREPALGPRKEA